MSEPVSLRFESRLAASPECVWQWVTSVEGITAELRPWLRMTAPRHVSSLADLEMVTGKPLFRSRVFLFGILPIDHSDLTLLEFDAGHGFIEQSPMASMRLWRHERTLHPAPQGGVVLVDQLTFQPRLARALVAAFIRRVFTHRHRVLRKRLGEAGAQTTATG